MNQYYLRLSQVTVFVFSVTALFFFFDPLLLLLSLILGWFFQGYVLELIIHRKYAHNQFQYKNKFIEYFSYFCIVAASIGRPIEWSYGHRVHHRHTDQDNDPQSPHSRGKLKTLLSIFPRGVQGWDGIINDLINDKNLVIFNKFYYIFLVIYYGLFFIIDPVLALYFIGIPSLVCWLSLGFVNTFAHQQKFKPNNLKWPLLFWGANYHSVHHEDSRRQQLGKFDLSFYVMKRIKL